MNMDALLKPIVLRDFIAQYWESELLHVSRTDAGYFSSLLSVAEIETFLTEQNASFPDVQVVDSSRTIQVAEYTAENKKIVPQHLMRFHQQGATIVISQAQQKFDALSRLCKGVTKSFQVRCQANAYLSPPGHQGFHSHYDTHDVFILQVSGSKTFRFFRSDIELPFPDDAFHPENNSAGEVLAEAKLNAGDTLYIPRGMVHDALADQIEPSLHITLGVFPFVMRDLLQEMVQVASERHVKYRRSVENSADHDKSSDFSALLGDMFTDEIKTEALSRLADELATDSMPPESPDASSIESSLKKISPAALISIIESEVLGFERRGEQLKLRLIGQVLTFTEPMSSAVEALMSDSAMKVEALPGLDDEQKQALCAHLLRASALNIINK